MPEPVETKVVPDESVAPEQWGGSTDFLPDRIAETAASTVAAQAAAQIQARYAIAMRQKRSVDQARAILLKDCKRPAFAESATYSKPVGGGTVRGFSIRFAEASARALGNLLTDTITVYDDGEKRIVRVTVTDLEANSSYGKDVSISKTVERRELRRGQTPIAKRTNSRGDTVYIVEASEDDLTVKENALVSKALRTLLLRHVPGDIIEDCERQVMETLSNQTAKDPEAEKKRLIDAFAVLNVMPKDLEDYLGHELGKTVPAELVTLRKVYTALKEGESTWLDFMEQRRAERGEQPKQQGQQAGAPNGKPRNLTELGNKVRAEQQATAQGQPPQQQGMSEEQFESFLQGGQQGPQTGTGTSEPPKPAAQVPLAQRSLDEVAAMARSILDPAEFARIGKAHGTRPGDIGFGLGGDAQKAFKAELFAQIERLQRTVT